MEMEVVLDSYHMVDLLCNHESVVDQEAFHSLDSLLPLKRKKNRSNLPGIVLPLRQTSQVELCTGRVVLKFIS